ncbi:MAG: hypothetical protein QXS93_00735 [Candidatus Micrarchaeia archaeon]
MNKTYNKLVKKTEGKILEEDMRRDHFRQVAKRYFSLCYDVEVKRRIIDDLSEKIAVKSSYGISDAGLVSARNNTYAQLRESSKKKRLTEVVVQNTVKTPEDVCLFMDKAREVHFEKDKNNFFYELNNVFWHGALFGIALWCVDAFITVFSTEFRNSLNIGAFLKDVFSSLPFAVLISTGISFIYHINRYSKVANLMEKIHDDICAFANLVQRRDSHKDNE